MSNQALVDPDNVVRAPTSQGTSARYRTITRRYRAILYDMHMDPNNVDSSGSRNKTCDPVSATKLPIMKQFDLQRGLLRAYCRTNRRSIKSSVVAFWESLERSTPYSELPDGSFLGNPETEPEIQAH